MSTTAFSVNLEEQRISGALQDTAQRLERAQGEVVLDFSSVRRIDSAALRALEAFALVADEKTVKIVLRGVNINVYKVLKLLKLTQRFSFAH